MFVATQERPLRENNHTSGRFERWILPHRATLLSYAQRLTGNRNDAEDLVQETLLRAYERQEQLTTRETVGAWLYTMQRNLFINAYRKRQRGPQFTELLEEGPTPVSKTLPSPETTVTRQMEQEAVMEAMRALPQLYRDVIVLADVEQKSYQEIAEEMGVPVGTVRSRIARGRQRLQRALWAWRNVSGADVYRAI